MLRLTPWLSVVFCLALGGWTSGRCVAQQAPFALEFANYLGGSGGENFRDVAVDGNSNIYVTGGTSSSDFPTTPGAFDRSFATGGTALGTGGPMDVFVAKLSGAGKLIWATYVGGPNYDRAYAIEVGQDGSVFIAGRAGPGFPTIPGTIQPAFGGDLASGANAAYGKQDGFIAKLSPDGSQLLWATYFGGGDSAIIRDVDVDPNGDCYVVSPGNVYGNHPHVTAGAYDTTHNGGQDAVVAKISADGRQVIWGTYLGGSLNDGGGPSVRVDPCSHAVYVIGNTSSTDFPTPNGHDRVLVGSANGNGEAFLAKLSPDGARLEWATFLGGSGDEGCGTHNLAIGPRGEVIAAHWTKSTDIPILPGGFQSSHRGGTTDCIIWNFSPDGTLLANTYLGGNGDENIQGTVVDEQGNVYLSVDASTSTDFPTTPTAFQQTNGGAADGAFAVFSPDLARVRYATYLGGSAHDGSREAALGLDGSYVCAGDTASANFPLRNAFDSTLAGGSDGFVARFVPEPPIADLNLDGDVGFEDLSELAIYWMQNASSVDIAPPPFGDSMVDFKDLAVLAEYWHTLPGIVAHWKLDEAEGNIAYDSAGVNDAFVIGEPVWQPDSGKVGGALAFDGIDDCLFAQHGLNPADGAFSVLVWVKGGAPGQIVISQLNGANWLRVDPTQGCLMTELCAWGRSGDPLHSDTEIIDGNWHRVGFIWDGLYRSLYVDDTLIAEDTQQGLRGCVGGLNIGCGIDPAAGTFWSGLFDDIRIYNRAIHP